MKVVVIGAGVLGAATARSLQAAGARVTLLETAQPGSGTSSRGAGLVAEGMWHKTSLRLVTRSLQILAQLSRSGEGEGHPFWIHETGSTTLLPPALMPAGRALARMQRGEGVPVEELQPEDALALPDHTGMRVDDVALALHYPRDGWALPRVFSEVCAAQAERAGARLVRGEASLMRGPDGVAVWAEGGRHEADAVVVAAGVRTRALLRDAGLDAPLLAYRTQALRFESETAHRVPILHDAVQGFYLRPGGPHELVAGNGTTTTPEDVLRWKDTADDAFVERTARRLRHRFPGIGGRVADAWAGIDAATPDRLLLAGAHPEDARVWLLAGGNGHGFMRAPAAGESLAAMLLGEKPPVDMEAYAPSRFADLSALFDIREGYSLEGPD